MLTVSIKEPLAFIRCQGSPEYFETQIWGVNLFYLTEQDQTEVS